MFTITKVQDKSQVEWAIGTKKHQIFVISKRLKKDAEATVTFLELLPVMWNLDREAIYHALVSVPGVSGACYLMYDITAANIDEVVKKFNEPKNVLKGLEILRLMRGKI